MAKSKKKKILLILVPIILGLVLLVLPLGLSYWFYGKVFEIRYTTDPTKSKHVEDFEGLMRDRYEIVSDKGQKLVGYNYYKDTDEVKGIIIMAHGIGGGGHNSYMDIANDLADSGYYAFAYDATGNDESEGESVGGLPQGVIDLEHVIDFVEQQDKFRDLPIGLLGHSWGGYSVANVLNEHPEVDCVVSFAGFSKSSDLLKAQGRIMIGPVIYVFMPYMNLIEYIKFGGYSSQTGLEGLEKTDAKVLIFQGGRDGTVPRDFGYDLYYEKFSDDPDFEFVLAEECGHNDILSEKYINMAIDFFDENMN